ncbi:anthranilate synthase component I family protein [Frigoribacterium sp. CFBP 13712]|uniref:anthranilate synthase component I family protein n=1 Tax=Frigoribacterium sp. CFBP 13712 TaxID=2775309 RepID=UPI001782FB8A|nr:anthranilate synthase component I family protein [Frigoribacterium sp. CFBP 13712]MBD8702185.1 anthranilate synthase component I family protein [Frigoribacterium sp. CFBP 13712]
MRPPVVRAPLEWRDPELVVSCLATEGDVVWIDAGLDAATGRSVLAWGEAVTASASGGRLDAVWSALHDDLSAPRADADPLGWAGWLGYGVGLWLLDRDGGLGRGAHPVNDAGERADGTAPPDLALLRTDRALVFDHALRTVEAVSTAAPDWLEGVVARWDDLEAEEARLETAPHRASSTHPRWDHDAESYLALVARCQEAIVAGEAYVLCPTTRVAVDGAVDDLAVYRRLRRTSAAPRASFVRIGGTSVLGASPEAFVEVSADGTVSSSPIKGTRPRGRDALADAELSDELATSEKELAENLMIVDLVRNDLTRVCAPGSVEVVELFAVHSYPAVHQLVSTVRGRLRPGLTGLDAVASMFPAGSMTGAPKRRAVELLTAWEARPRGIYSGAIGTFGLDGTVSLAMVIRSIVVDRAGAGGAGTATVGVGGGVTSASVPRAEWDEVGVKAAALLAVLADGPTRAS